MPQDPNEELFPQAENDGSAKKTKALEEIKEESKSIEKANQKHGNDNKKNKRIPLTEDEIAALKKKAKIRRLALAGGTAFFVVAATVLILFLVGAFSKGTDSGLPESLPKKDVKINSNAINPLTGLRELDPSAAGNRPVSFMVNNAPAARPQWGLCSPDIILETMVEGGITRMLFMYADINTVPKIGPIRSARHDFVEIAQGFDSFFVHWGGSPQAYEMLRSETINSLDGMVYSETYFFRDQARRNKGIAIEHTAYTSGKDIAKAIKNKQWRTQLETDKESPFSFVQSEESPRVPLDGAAFKADFRFSYDFRYSFSYDEETGLYAQSLNGKPFVQEEDSQQREVKNILLLYINVSNIAGDKKGRVNIDLSSGDGIYISQGAWETISWKKGQPNDSLKLFDKDGKLLELNRGKGYIGMLPISQKSNTKITGEPSA